MLFKTSQLSSDVCFSELLIFDRPSRGKHPLLFSFLLSCIHCPANSGRESVKKLFKSKIHIFPAPPAVGSCRSLRQRDTLSSFPLFFIPVSCLHHCQPHWEDVLEIRRVADLCSKPGLSTPTKGSRPKKWSLAV